MTPTPENITIPYEIAMSIDTSQDLGKMLRKTIGIYLKKLNCSVGCVIQASLQDNKVSLETVFSIPRNANNNTDFQKAFQEIPLNPSKFAEFSSTPFYQFNYQNNSQTYILQLENFGFLILVKNNQPLPDYIFHMLKPLNKKLAEACLACINRQALTESEEKYRNIFKSIHDVYAEIDFKTGKVVEITPSIYQVSGFTREEMLGQRLDSYYADPKQRSELIRMLATKSIANDFEVNLINKNGSIIPCSFSVKLVKNENGIPLKVVGTMRDISERKKAEMQIQQTNTELEKRVRKRTTELWEKNKELVDEIIVRKQTETALTYRISIEELVTDISTQFITASSENIADSISKALNKLGHFLQIDRAYVYMFSKNTTNIKLRYQWFLKKNNFPLGETRLETSDIKWISGQVNNGKSINFKNVKYAQTKAKEDINKLAGDSVRSLLIVPICYGNKTLGFLGFDTLYNTKEWVSADIRLMGLFGETLGSILEHEKIDKNLHESEEKYRTLVERANDAIIIQQNNKIIYANPKFCQISDQPEKEILGKALIDFLSFSTAQEEKKFNHNLNNSKSENIVFECELLKSKQETLLIELNAGHITYFNKPAVLVIIRDIEERKIMQEQISQTQKLNAIGELAAGISHEINTPIQYVSDNLNFINENLPLLTKLFDEFYKHFKNNAKNGTDSKAKEMIDQMDHKTVAFLREQVPIALGDAMDGISRVGEITKAMKQFTHPGLLEKEHVDINNIVKGAVTVSRNSWKYVAEIEYDLDPFLPPIPCLAGELNQVILNIVVNAAHAIQDVVGENPQNKGTITLKTFEENSDIKIHIKDTGTGIPKKIAQNIFDPFFTTKEVGRGTGQGLTIVHNIVTEKLGGTITFVNNKSNGTTFIITLPKEENNGEIYN